MDRFLNSFRSQHPWLTKKILIFYWNLSKKLGKKRIFWLSPDFGIKMWLRIEDNSVSRQIYFNKYEIETVKFLSQYCQQSDIAFDIGANIGFYTLLFSKLIGMNGQVHAFEPSLREFVWLSENVQLSTLFNVHLNHFALSNYDGFIEMKIFEEATFGAYNTLGIPSHPAVLGRNIQSRWVRTMKLDTYCHLFGGIVPDLIKMDVEGAELNVLLGAQDLLSKEGAPLLIVEACESTLKGFNRTISELIQYLTALGYRLFALQPNGHCLPIDQISAGYLNIVAAKPNHISRLQQRGLVRALPHID